MRFVNPGQLSGRAPKTNLRRLRIGTLFALGLVFLSGCDGEGFVPRSDRAITRIEVTPSGDILALNQRVGLGPATSSLDPVTSLPETLEFWNDATVYRSQDGRRWTRTSLNPSDIVWTNETSGCVGGICVAIDATEFLGSSLAAPVVGLADGEPVFELDEDLPQCHSGESGSEACAESQSLPGPFDIATREGEDPLLVVAYGTQGVAVFDGAEWHRSNVNTPGPARWIWANLGTVALLATVTMLVASVGLFIIVFRRRDMRRT